MLHFNNVTFDTFACQTVVMSNMICVGSNIKSQTLLNQSL